METFAQRYCHCNPGVFQSTGIAVVSSSPAFSAVIKIEITINVRAVKQNKMTSLHFLLIKYLNTDLDVKLGLLNRSLSANGVGECKFPQMSSVLP